MGVEGILAKRLDSPYRPGQRSPEWLKIKNLLTQEVVIGGYTVGDGRRAGTPSVPGSTTPRSTS